MLAVLWAIDFCFLPQFPQCPWPSFGALLPRPHRGSIQEHRQIGRERFHFFFFFIFPMIPSRARAPHQPFSRSSSSPHSWSAQPRSAAAASCGRHRLFLLFFFFRHFSRASPAVGCMQLFVRECTCSPSRSSLDSGFHSLVNRCSPLI